MKQILPALPSSTWCTRLFQAALLSATVSVLVPAAQAQSSWNAYKDFYFSPTTNGWEGSTDGTGSPWGYYMGNVNGYGNPTSIGRYLPPWILIKLSDANPAGASDGTRYSSSFYDPTGGDGYPRYRDAGPWGVWGVSLGRYDNAWFPGAPGYSQGLRNFMWLQAAYLQNTNAPTDGPAEGIASVLTWTAPNTGTYTIAGRFVSGDQAGNGASVAIADSVGGPSNGDWLGTTPLPRESLANNSVREFSITKAYTAGDVVQFQVGTDYKTGNAVGLQLDIKYRGNAYNEFYFSPTTAGWSGSTNGAGNNWGYYLGNVNGGSGFPARIGNYLTPGQIYKLSDANPAGASDGTRYSSSFYDPTGGAGFPRYADNQGWGASLGRFDNAWFPGAPGYSQELSNFIWMQANSIGNPAAEGIASVLIWKAPTTAAYTFTGRFVAANQVGNAASVAIVDSEIAALPRTVMAINTIQNFSFTKYYHAGELVQFQVGSDSQVGNAVGLQVDVDLAPLSNWNAKRDFYHTPTASGWTGATAPSEAGSAWGYYAANLNGFEFPTEIGTYFTLNGSGSGSANLYRYSSYSPLGDTGERYNNSTFDPTGGLGLASYRDPYEWDTSIAFFDAPWYNGAPGYGTEARGGLWMKAAWLNPLGEGIPPAEGICPVVTWTAPSSGIYDFKGSFQIGDNGSSFYGASLAIVASSGTAPMARTSAIQGTDHPFWFRRTLNQGDVIQFQAGSDFKEAVPVALNADVIRVGDVGQKVPSSAHLDGSSTLAYSGSGVTPTVTVLGSSSTPTYSYKGVDGTSYGPSGTAPTNRGRYEVTVTTEDDTNWSSVTNKFYYSVGTFNAFKDFWWNRTNGREAWMNPASALAQGRSQGTPTTKNAWGYGLIDSTSNQITEAGINLKFQALGGYAYNSGNSSWTYHNGDPAGTRISLVAANSNSTSLVLSPSAGAAGYDGKAAALRWTAPAAGTYRFQGSFVSQGSDSMSVAVHTLGDPDLEDNTTFLARTNVAASATLAFDFTNTVVANQTVTWVVGSDGASDGDVILLSANVSDVLGTPPSAVPPTITSTDAFSGTVGVSFNDSITATGDTPIAFSGTDLPAGLSVASGGAITGTPTAAGTFNATLTATNVAGTTNQAATFTIAKGTQATVLGSLGSSTISSDGTTTVTASGGSGSGAYEFRQNGGTGSVGFTGTGDSRTINPLSAGTAEIEVRRLADDNYNDSAWSSAGTLTIHPAAPADSSFSGWLSGNSPSAALLLQYAYGASSASSAVSRSNYPSMTLSNSNLVLTYYVRKNATNPNLVTPQVTTNLATNSWSNVAAGNITSLATNTVGGVEVIQRRASVPVDNSRKFLRLKIAE